MIKNAVTESWMYELGITGDDVMIFSLIYTNSKATADDIAKFMHKRRDSVCRNIDKLTGKSLIVERNHKLCVAQNVLVEHENDTPSHGALFDVSKPKKQSIISLRNEIKGKIEDFVMHRCENDQELLRLLLEYLRIVGTSKKSLVPSVWDKKLEELDGHSKSVADKIASVNNALSATPVYSRFYPVKKQAQTNGTPVFDPRPFGKYDVVTEADLGDDFIV